MMRRVIVLALATAALAAPVAQAGQRGDFVKEPTAVGSGGAAGTVDALATKAAIDTLKRGGNAVDATVAAAGVLGVTEPFSAGIGGGGFMVIRTPQGRVTTIDGREKAPAAMRPDSFFENGAAAPLRRRPLERPVGRRARHGRAVGRGAGPLRLQVAEPAAAAGDPRRAPRVRGRPDLRRPDHAGRRLLQRHPLDRGDLPRSRRHAARRRQHAAQPRPRPHVRADRPLRRARVLHRPDRPRDRRTPRRTRRSARTPTTSGGPA